MYWFNSCSPHKSTTNTRLYNAVSQPTISSRLSVPLASLSSSQSVNSLTFIMITLYTLYTQQSDNRTIDYIICTTFPVSSDCCRRQGQGHTVALTATRRSHGEPSGWARTLPWRCRAWSRSEHCRYKYSALSVNSKKRHEAIGSAIFSCH